MPFRSFHARQRSEPPPNAMFYNNGKEEYLNPPLAPDKPDSHLSRLAQFQRDRPPGTCSPFQAYQNHLQAKNQQELFASPILHRRNLDRWHSPAGSPLRNQEDAPYHSGNTSPIVLQRFYHQQKQQQLQKEAEEYAKTESGLGRKRIASYIKLQLNSDRTRSSRHQSPEPPPRLNRSAVNQSPLALRRHFFESNPSASTGLSRRYISPTPPVPPPRRLSESISVPGSPQHVRARFHYTPEPQRRLFQSNDVS